MHTLVTKRRIIYYWDKWINVSLTILCFHRYSHLRNIESRWTLITP
jgi:hypothetical protein